ncbi:MAG: hypothetical protein Q7S96_00020 [bacterium]|nr:hypothetical protein [bacterium]
MAQLREQVRADVVDDVQRGARKARRRKAFLRCGGCCGVVFLLVLLVAGSLAYVVARSGVISLPVLGNRVGHERAPRRVVIPESLVVDERLARALHTAQDGHVTLAFTEAELTALLREALAGNRDLPSGLAESIQVTVGDDVEIFSRMELLGGDATTVLLRGTPVLAGREVAIAFHEATIGAMPIPSRLIEWIIARALAGKELPVALESIVLRDQEIAVEVNVDPDRL